MLTIEGTPTDEEINAAWDSILMEYSEAIGGDGKKSKHMEYQANINISKAMWVSNAVLYLRKDYHHDLAMELKAKFHGIKLDYEDRFQFYRDLDRCIAIAKTWQFEAERMYGQMKDIFQKKGEAVKAPTLDMFLGTLEHLSSFKGYYLNENELTVLRFCVIYNQMKASKEKNDVRNSK